MPNRFSVAASLCVLALAGLWNASVRAEDPSKESAKEAVNTMILILALKAQCQIPLTEADQTKLSETIVVFGHKRGIDISYETVKRKATIISTLVHAKSKSEQASYCQAARANTRAFMEALNDDEVAATPKPSR